MKSFFSLLWLLVVAVGCHARTGDLPSPNRYKTFLFGVDYYPEQWPEKMWELDARRMQELGLGQ